MARHKEYENVEQAAKEIVQKKKKLPTPASGNNGFSPVIGNNGIYTKPGDNSKYAIAMLDLAQNYPILANALTGKESLEEIAALRRVVVDKNDINTMAQRFVGYLAYCVLNDERISNVMAYARCGITKDDVYNWEHGISRGEEHHDFVVTIKQVCSAAREALANDGKLSPVTLIWWQKQYDGYVENNTITLVNGGNKVEEVNKEEIAAKYANSLPIIDVPPTE